ncbi:MAG: 2Fe-2S iron-sulfur cluster binding domain-containing protein [Achromobacter sp.]|nr:2Fe-2S iron-sulfur cluster binding domain-containing protein [Achromobacter sp.]
MARQLAFGLSKLWGQPVVVENRTGASGIVALTALARAPSDGYTLGIMVSPVTAIAPLTQPNFRYDVTQDFTAVSDLVDYALVLLAGPQTKAANLKELVEFAKQKRTIECRSDMFVLDAARRAGVRLPSSCSKGLCGTCKSKLVEGTVEMKHGGGIRQREIDAGMALLCCSKPTSNLVVDR